MISFSYVYFSCDDVYKYMVLETALTFPYYKSHLFYCLKILKRSKIKKEKRIFLLNLYSEMFIQHIYVYVCYTYTDTHTFNVNADSYGNTGTIVRKTAFSMCEIYFAKLLTVLYSIYNLIQHCDEVQAKLQRKYMPWSFLSKC
jgi:hypothetical protein